MSQVSYSRPSGVVSVSGSVALGATGEVSTTLSTTAPLVGGDTWTSSYLDVSGYANLSVVCTVVPTNATGTVYADFSPDGVNADSTISWPIANGSSGSPHMLSTTRQYVRIRVVNDATAQTQMRLQTLVYRTARIAIPTSRFSQSIDDNTDVLNARAVLTGQYPGGTYANVGISERDALMVESSGPLTGFGEQIVADETPRVQIDAVYGIRTSDHETFSASGGTATASNSLFQVTTGTSVGGYGVIRSLRTVKYATGQGLRYRISALMTSPGVANSLQAAGVFTSTDGLFVGFNGTTFGFTRRIAGAAAIMQLTVTVGTGGAPETGTVTLNGTAFAVALGAGLTTTAVAEAVAERVGGYTGWSSNVSPQSNNSMTTFIQATPAATAGAFTFTSTGTATGTFATIQAGAANDDTTGFVPQSSWNVDVLDGTGSSSNPSGVLLDPTKLNLWEIVQAQGGGSIRLRYQMPTGRMITVHRILYPNSATVEAQRNPSYRVGWIAASLGSTTNLTVKGSIGAGFIEGQQKTLRDPYAATNRQTVDATEYVILALRSRGEFGGTNNQRVMTPSTLFAAVETSNRLVRIKLYVNPTLTGTVNWAYVNQSESCMEYATPTTLTASGGRYVMGASVPTGAPLELAIHELDLRTEAGDTLVVTAQTASSTAVTDVTMNWEEY